LRGKFKKNIPNFKIIFFTARQTGTYCIAVRQIARDSMHGIYGLYKKSRFP